MKDRAPFASGRPRGQGAGHGARCVGKSSGFRRSSAVADNFRCQRHLGQTKRRGGGMASARAGGRRARTWARSSKSSRKNIWTKNTLPRRRKRKIASGKPWFHKFLFANARQFTVYDGCPIHK